VVEAPPEELERAHREALDLAAAGPEILEHGRVSIHGIGDAAEMRGAQALELEAVGDRAAVVGDVLDQAGQGIGLEIRPVGDHAQRGLCAPVKALRQAALNRADAHAADRGIDDLDRNGHTARFQFAHALDLEAR